jgi:hypothetical protein
VAGLGGSVGVDFCCRCVVSGHIWWISFAVLPHRGIHMHFVSISDVTEAWENVYGEVYEHR